MDNNQIISLQAFPEGGQLLATDLGLIQLAPVKIKKNVSRKEGRESLKRLDSILVEVEEVIPELRGKVNWLR